MYERKRERGEATAREGESERREEGMMLKCLYTLRMNARCEGKGRGRGGVSGWITMKA